MIAPRSRISRKTNLDLQNKQEMCISLAMAYEKVIPTRKKNTNKMHANCTNVSFILISGIL